MNLRLIALAALAAAGSAQAALITPAQLDAARANNTLKEYRIFGASAQSRMIGAYMKSICNTGDFTTYFDTTSGSLHRGYACTLAKKVGQHAVGTLIFVNKREAGGSILGVNPIALNAPQNAMQVTAASSCVATGLAADVNSAAYTCGQVALQNGHAGISDVEPARFSDVVTVDGVDVPVNLPPGNDDSGAPWAVLTTAQINALDVAAVNQTLFGIAVNIPLRNALQQAQGLNVGSDAAADMPSMPRAFYAGAISGFVQGGSPNANWKTLTGIAGDEAKQVNICRRVNGSGTQASSNLFFLESATITSDANGMLFPLSATGALAVNGTIAVLEGSGTGNVETCLTNTTVANGGGYAMGVVSFEVDPGTKAYRFVKIDGAAPDKALARIGGYPFLYSASMQFKKSGAGSLNTEQKSFINAMRSQLTTPTIIAGLDAAPRKGVLAGPSSYTASCAEANGPAKTDGSCVERLDFKSTFNANTYLNGESAAFKTNSKQALHVVK
jgi:hypothetical protein